MNQYNVEIKANIDDFSPENYLKRIKEGLLIEETKFRSVKIIDNYTMIVCFYYEAPNVINAFYDLRQLCKEKCLGQIQSIM